ncbi:MAG: hypothetical protein LBO09_01930 [Candidatus Peribacteria bacterium]|jgi:hypothetical protein|nr:hypothetical protein [Candidatus Peribacteria bacterium]
MSLSFFKQEMSKWCEVIEETKEDGSKKSKIYFHIKSAEDYRAFLKDLTTHNSKDKSYKRLKSD